MVDAAPPASTLFVPIHVDALFVQTGLNVVGPSADFSRLPYFDGREDINPDIPFLSEELLAVPFQNQNLYLPPGIHLHWALPDALTEGAQGAGSTVFPNVPDRWLVIRSMAGTARSAQRGWVVESDYLHPPGSGRESGSATYPVAPPASSSGVGLPPYRYLGRAVPVEKWSANDPSARYLGGLSAVGYGEPMFAARYANCRNVFGLHDPDITAEPPQGLQYDVFGWYSNGSQDYLSLTLERIRETYRDAQGQPATPDANQLADAIGQQLGWSFDAGNSSEIPGQMRCYGRLRFDSTVSAGGGDGAITVAVAESGARALAAYLSSQAGLGLSPDDSERIDAVLLSARLQHLDIDLDAKLSEARHEAGFSAVSAGTLWTVVPDTGGQDPAGNPVPADTISRLLGTADIGARLRAVNGAQRLNDAALAEIEGLRRQLFADWYRYMLCLYPPQGSGEDYPNPDEVMAFIERHGISQLDQKVAGQAALADALAAARTHLRKSLADLNAGPAAQAARVTFREQALSAPRFWQPNDPVVLLAGPSIRPSPRHGQDGRLDPEGLLACQLSSTIDVATLSPRHPEAIVELIDSFRAPDGSEQIGFPVWRGPSWHPLQLEWEVDLLPAAGLSNVDPARGQYAPTFITDNYALGDNGPDLTPRDGIAHWSGAANLYSGASVLTPYARDYQHERLAAFIYGVYAKQQGLPSLSDQDAAAELRDENKQTLDRIRQWLASQKAATEEQRMLNLALRAFTHLGGIQCLSQALGGFNEALLMRRQTLQLPIDDPLGFADYRPFVARMKDRILGSNRSAPQPLNDFNPIRSGALRLRALRLVDNFGQVMDVNLDSVVYAGAPARGPASSQVPLPPRLVQPARLNFRWMSARDGSVEADAHPGTGPICGWVVANNLDHSLDVYDRSGEPLGAVGPAGTWVAIPGARPADAEQIENATLRKLVKHLLGYDENALMMFLDTLDTALFTIEPASYAQHAEVAVIMGRPLAVVRAAVDLELRDPPAAHQGWNQFRLDLLRDGRDHDAFTAVEFLIRIGDYAQLNDGLAGYWVERDGEPGDVFRALTPSHGDLAIRQSIDSPAQYLTMLIDPRGKVHAACGIVPVKAIDIPPAQYADALRRIAVTFRAGPLLGQADMLALPPAESGYRWSWLEVRGNGYREITTEPRIEQGSLGADVAEQIWERLLARDTGWLAFDAERSGVVRAVPPGSRASAAPGEFAGLRAEIEAALAQAQEPDTTIAKARFVDLAAAAIMPQLWAQLLDPRIHWLDSDVAQPGARVLGSGDRAAPALADRFAGLEAVVQKALDRRQYRIAPAASDATIPRSQRAREGWLVLRAAETESGR